nr:ATP-binding cassette domain-containing protein [Tabrizicola sp.]
MTLLEKVVATDAHLLKVEGLTKRYGPRIGCADASFDLYPGEVLGTVGESGSGKSTLLSCLVGHQCPDLGRIAHDRRDVLAMTETDCRRLSRTDWAHVHQNQRGGLRMGVSAGGNVGEQLMPVGARHYGEIRGKAVDWLGRVEIAADRVDNRTSAFSGGMQQSLQIVRNLETAPRPVFMDEPTASLDATEAEHVAWSARHGAHFAGFPPTFEAAQACKDHRIKVMMGAPSLIRAGSHSGNVAARDLAEADLLDIVSSNHVPS